MQIAQDYIRIATDVKGQKAWKDLSEEEKKELDKKFLAEVALSTFEREEKRRYMAVNLSSECENELVISLPHSSYEVITAERIFETDGKIRLLLRAGCSIYVKEK